MKYPYLLFVCILMVCSCKQENSKPYSVWMAESEIQRNPELWKVDFVNTPKWDYTQGLIALSMVSVSEASGNLRFFEYAKAFADTFIDSEGRIMTYKVSDYNLDRLNGGKFLWKLYHRTQEEKYYKAIVHLREQLDTQPRTVEGGFWHKKIYPCQMWLDGLYMGGPFYAQCASEFDIPSDFDDVTNQFTLIYRRTYDVRTGLNFHGWDESREQAWADKETGCSPHVWGRAMGWYFMGLVDVLDYIPESYSGREELLELLKQVAEGVQRAQDPASGLWFQVMDEPLREGNYLEATASSMFVYALLKAVRLNYLSADPYITVAQKGYEGIVRDFIREEGDGTISLTRCCAVAGLGGDPYRNGSFDYYVNEKIRDNDPKGVGPFILASLEQERLQRSVK
ncbi:Unsaturated rhamnogalacturonyl hydrolase YteR [termite gut metagenome]|uniref:Unsaturated rhamnogalacturonyl hydrolase YteR n=1 Tax=termite gut metagenome TaxID=433724 RepID=A0A5J4RSM0_9ZZZZ